MAQPIGDEQQMLNAHERNEQSPSSTRVLKVSFQTSSPQMRIGVAKLVEIKS